MNQHNREIVKISEQLKTHFIYSEALLQLICCSRFEDYFEKRRKSLKEENGGSDCKITTFIEKEAFETEVLQALLEEKEMLIKDQEKRSQITLMK